MGTSIGGTNYNDIGNSSAPLLLKSNGTVRVQWGNRFIDLIKNGKIASGNELEFILTVSSEEEISSTGIFIVDDQVWVSIDGTKINISGNLGDIYVSFTKELSEIDRSQKIQALSNIGFYYPTLDSAKEVTSGIVYIQDKNLLYVVRNGVLEPYSISSDEEEEKELEKVSGLEVVSTTEKDTALSLKELLELMLKDLLCISFDTTNVNIYKNLVIHDNMIIQSTDATDTVGFRLYNTDLGSKLEVDLLVVRKVSDTIVEVTYELLRNLIELEELIFELKYLITDYLNHWESTKSADIIYYTDGEKIKNVRPLIVLAKSNKELFVEAYFLEHPEWKLEYDPFFEDTLFEDTLTEGEEVVTTEIVKAKGRITKLTDEYGNCCNYDFKHLTFLVNGSRYYTFYKPQNNDVIPETEIHLLGDNNPVFLDATVLYLKEEGNPEEEVIIKNNTVYVEHLLIETSYPTDSKFIPYSNIKTEEGKNYLIASEDSKMIGNTILELDTPILLTKLFLNNLFLKNFKTSAEKPSYIKGELEDNIFNEIDTLYVEENTKLSENAFYGSIINLTIEKTSTISETSFYKEVENTKFNNCKVNEVFFEGEIKNISFSNIEDFYGCMFKLGISSDKSSIINISTIRLNLFNGEIKNPSWSCNSLKNCTFYDNIVDLTIDSPSGTIMSSEFVGEINGLEIKGSIENSSFYDISGSTFEKDITDCTFKKVENTTSTTLLVTSNFHDDLLKDDSWTLTDADLSKPNVKEVYVVTENGSKKLKIVFIQSDTFLSGMILMWYGGIKIPDGWVICDGRSYGNDGKRAPNLVGRFIKAAPEKEYTKEEERQSGSNEVTITVNNLPEHSHPHNNHFHSLTNVKTNNKSITLSTADQYVKSISSTSVNIPKDSGENPTSISVINSIESSNVLVSGSHNHSMDNSTTTNSLTSIESNKSWDNTPLKIEPKAYELLFIMKI